MRRLGDPQESYRIIHVAGTKGKGSITALCASALQAGGLRVGMYTSPHLQDYTERIQVNAVPISHAGMVELVEKIKPAVATIPMLTTFEITTALGFLYFAEQHVDVAVIEVGLGGRLDASNIITPRVSVISSLSYDHTAVLGNTLTEIAREKAGIIKPGVPVVSSPQKEEALKAMTPEQKAAYDKAKADKKAALDAMTPEQKAAYDKAKADTKTALTKAETALTAAKKLATDSEAALAKDVTGYTFVTQVTEFRPAPAKPKYAKVALAGDKAVAMPAAGRRAFVALIAVPQDAAREFKSDDDLFAALEAKKVKGAQAFGFPSTATVADSVKGDPVKWTYTITGVDEKGIRTRVEGEGADKQLEKKGKGPAPVSAWMAGGALALALTLGGLWLAGRARRLNSICQPVRFGSCAASGRTQLSQLLCHGSHSCI